MLNKVLRYSFYLLFAITPLVWLPFTHELFEFNKMMFVYLLTAIIIPVWLLRMVQEKRLIVRLTPLSIPLLLFLTGNFISSIISIDPHTSWWGYYSRSNGGFVSILSYLLLYLAFTSNFDTVKTLGFLKAVLWGGTVVAVWGILEHFGVSPSCIILTGQANTACWIQEVQARVFATLGQPNWLAAYLAMLIFLVLFFLLTAKGWLQKIFYLLLTTCYYLAFTFAYSRGATLGLIAGGIVFSAGLIVSRFYLKTVVFILILAIFFTLSIFFGSALSSYRLIKKYSPPPRPLTLQSSPSSGSKLESGENTETGQIRLIVWRGALEIFKHYPLFGSGVETFAYSYYSFRPQEHNLTSEWDYLYNKAHNEYLNYLATTGIVGFGSYLLIILTYIIWSVRYQLVNIKKAAKKVDLNPSLQHHLILNTGLLAGYVSYLVQNIFSFSVVIIALLFFLFPAFIFVFAEASTDLRLTQRFSFMLSKDNYLTKLLMIVLSVVMLSLIFTLFCFFQADVFYEKGLKNNDNGNPGRAYNELIQATTLNPHEPLYQIELGLAEAGASIALADTDATLSSQLKDQSFLLTQKVLRAHPKHISLFRTAIKTYYLLSTRDPQIAQRTVDLLDETIRLAPTDPKLYYNKAIILGSSDDKISSATATIQQALQLKPNYRDAHFAYGLFLFQSNKKEEAIAQMKTVLKLMPGDLEASEKLKAWQ